MPIVETTITIRIPEGGATLGELEGAVARAVNEGGRRLLGQACGEVEEQELTRLGRRARQVKVRPLDMLTRFGWLRLERRQVVERERYCRPVDNVLGLAPRQHASPWVQEEAIALAKRIPYGQATTILSRLLETPLDHRTVYAWVQRAGSGGGGKGGRTARSGVWGWRAAAQRSQGARDRRHGSGRHVHQGAAGTGPQFRSAPGRPVQRQGAGERHSQAPAPPAEGTGALRRGRAGGGVMRRLSYGSYTNFCM